MSSDGKSPDGTNPIADFFRTIPAWAFVMFVTFIWAGSLYQSLEPYELGPVLTYGIIVVTAIPVGLFFQKLHDRI